MILVEHVNGCTALRAQCYNCADVSKKSIKLYHGMDLSQDCAILVAQVAASEGWQIYGRNMVCERCSTSKDFEVFAIEDGVENYLRIGHIMKNQSGGIIRINGEQYEFWNGSTWVTLDLPPGLHISLNLLDKWRIVHPEELEDKP